MTIRQRDDGDHVVLAVRGDLSLAAVSLSVLPVLSKQLLDRGRVIVDLSGATLWSAPAAGLFPTALARAGGWPLARLVLAGPDPSTAKILQLARVHLTVPLARNVDEARVMLAARPPRVVRSHELPCTATTPTLARSLVMLAREDWALPDELCDAALTVTTEFVSNAVEHARTRCVLYLALDDRRLRIAVRDQRPEVQGFLEPGVRGNRGYGLLIVEGLSRRWGVTSHDDGKTVWALLDTGPDRTWT
jgi:anti-sigma regulatory factor (Ser/Thr protein kinase)